MDAKKRRIEIWAPRWHDRVVLISTRRIGEINEIVFTKTKAISPEQVFVVPASVIRQYPIVSNGKIQCYAVPLNVILGEDL